MRRNTEDSAIFDKIKRNSQPPIRQPWNQGWIRSYFLIFVCFFGWVQIFPFYCPRLCKRVWGALPLPSPHGFRYPMPHLAPHPHWLNNYWQIYYWYIFITSELYYITLTPTLFDESLRTSAKCVLMKRQIQLIQILPLLYTLMGPLMPTIAWISDD